MSRIIYKYRIEITANVNMTPWGRNKKLTNAQLEELRHKINTSFQPGGINFPPLNAPNSIIPHISRLVMMPNAYFDTNKVIAEARGPMFEVV